MSIALFTSRSKAEPLQKRLTDAGISAEIHDETRLEKLWFVTKNECCVRLEVPAQQFERAENLLLQWDAAGDACRDAIRCPECRSLRLQYPQFTRKSLMTNFFLGMAAELHLIDREFYCEDCHFTWPREGTRPSRARPNGAPYYFIEGAPQAREQHAEQHRQAA